MTTTEEKRLVDDISAIRKICAQIEKLSDNDLDRLCWLIDGEYLARKEKEEHDTSIKPV